MTVEIKKNIFQERFRELVGDTATQEEIAKKVNTSRQNVGNWLKGKSKPDIYALAEIAKGYNVSTDYLLGLKNIKIEEKEPALQEAKTSSSKNNSIDNDNTILKMCQEVIDNQIGELVDYYHNQISDYEKNIFNKGQRHGELLFVRKMLKEVNK